MYIFSDIQNVLRLLVRSFLSQLFVRRRDKHRLKFVERDRERDREIERQRENDRETER